MFLVQLVVFCEDTVHDLRDIVLIWFEEYDQILHGAVSGADIYGADIDGSNASCIPWLPQYFQYRSFVPAQFSSLP